MRLSKPCSLLAAAVLFLGTASANITEAASFHLGDTGSDIIEIQQALASRGYDVVVDGDYGPATEAAVAEFQKDNHLDVDGKIGSNSYQALFHRAMPVITNHQSYFAGANGIIDLAQQFLGVPYVWGGSSPNGFDCSGFVQYVFAQKGIHLPRTADIQATAGRPVSKSELMPGDLVFFAGDYVNISHVGIYVGNGQMIHASSSHGIAYDSLSRDYRVAHYAGACRVLN
ncbi:NlpC/P60 family protein [Selenomonas ruminantium]|uniref:C40 family peptidase n=1 Tax=Selenomonas ruminantium TaxID=971 RepID=UPI0026EE3029|nr:NlpC/P60 family protein [Selenomonas ruminantium]